MVITNKSLNWTSLHKALIDVFERNRTTLDAVSFVKFQANLLLLKGNFGHSKKEYLSFVYDSCVLIEKLKEFVPLERNICTQVDLRQATEQLQVLIESSHEDFFLNSDYLTVFYRVVIQFWGRLRYEDITYKWLKSAMNLWKLKDPSSAADMDILLALSKLTFDEEVKE